MIGVWKTLGGMMLAVSKHFEYQTELNTDDNLENVLVY
jgi:hypothetical protein